ncbi:hypothetical protein MKX03_028233 [Papaver bracteatum]|nr:hypothetical protein MKX03_028233 [Papaver bracteatum]
MTFEKEEELKLDKPLNHEMGLLEELEITVTKNCELSVKLEMKNKECIAIENKFNDLELSKIAVDNELKECKRTNDGLNERIIRLELENTDVCEREKRAEKRIIYLEEQIRDLENGKSRAENETEIWKKRCRELETRLSKAEEESSSLRCLESAGIVEISDSGDEKEISPKHTCPSSFTPKKKRCRKRVFTDSESEEDDTIPIGKLKMMKMEQKTGISIPKLSPLSPCTRDVAVSSEAHNVKESVTPSRRRLLSQRQREKKKSRVGKTSNCENMSLNNVKTGASSQEKVCNLTAESDEEEAGSESEGDSLGGFIVQDGESSESGDNSCESSDNGDNSCESGDSSSIAEDMVDSDLDYDQIKAKIERRKPKETKWQFEADMLSSFVKDPILCMKAVCALYRQQTAEEKSIKSTLHLNKRGFSQAHATRGTQLAEFLSDGSQEDDLVKSVEELEMFDPKGLKDCRKFARHYSKQLFAIYLNEEDPLFVPS